MKLMRTTVALVAAFGMLSTACTSRDDSDSSDGGGDSGGDTDVAGIDTADCGADPTEEIEGDTITLASSYPQSGLTAAFAEIARGWQAYFEMVNDEGGVEIAGNNYTIEWEVQDDEYNPADTSQNIEEIVGSDGSGAFAAFSVVGTANNVAIRDFLGDLCVPNLFAATGSPQWGNPDYPWTIGSTLPPYPDEAQAFVEVLQEEQPDARIAILRQNDDFGEAYEATIRNAIEGSDMEVVAVESYPPGANDVGTQVTSLANSDANVFFNGGTLLACPDALAQADANGWQPDFTWMSGTCLSKSLMGIAGDLGEGVYGASNVMDPLNPDLADAEAMQLYRDTVQEYQPEADVENGIVAYGWTQAALFVQALEQAEAPTRLAVMDSVRHLEAEAPGMIMEGLSVATDGTDDLFFGEEMEVVQYQLEGDSGFFAPVGTNKDYSGETADLTPEGLIN